MSTLYIRYPSTAGTIGPSSFPLEAPNGTAAAPSYAFGGGTGGAGTGIYAAGTNILGFATAGVKAGQIASNQRWTIGSTVTEGQVHTISAVDTLGVNSVHLILSSGAAANIPFYIAKDRTDGFIGISGSGAAGSGAELRLFGSAYGGGFNNYWRFMQNNVDVMTIDQNGIITSIGQFIGKGTATNDSAAAGYIGQYIESVVSSPTNITGATTAWGNMTSISLTAGDWDVSGVVTIFNNGSTIVNGTLKVAISVNSGTTTSDQINGSNQLDLPAPGAAIDRGMSICSYRLSLSGTTTVYFKSIAQYTVATPQFQCRLSARRMR